MQKMNTRDDPISGLLLKLPSFPSKNRRQEPAAHTQNSVERERPQNKHLKPFKSRAELGGQLDPRINKGGRPKIMREQTAAYLEEKDKRGVTKRAQNGRGNGRAGAKTAAAQCISVQGNSSDSGVS